MKPTSERIRQVLHYNPQTGVFVRLEGYHRVLQETGFKNGHGYWMVSVDGRNYRGHQLAWAYMRDEWPSADIDHIDGDRANNRWANLRAASRSQNLGNMGRRKDNRSGIKGVSWDAARGKWKTQIKCGALRICKRFDTKDEAAAAYLAAADRLYGEFARAA